MSARRSVAVHVLAAVATVAALTVAAPARAAGTWTVVDLGSLGGSSGAWGISPSGEWIAGWSYTSTGQERIVRWHRDAPGRYSMQVLQASYAAYGEGFDVNDAGTVVGWLSGCTGPCEQAVVWSPDGTLTVLPISGGALWVSPDSATVAGRMNPTPGTWTLADGTWTPHPVVGEQGEIYDVDNGIAVGHARFGAPSVPVRWLPGSTAPERLPLPAGATYGVAMAADQGVIVGMADQRPTRWVGGVPQFLPGGGSKPRMSAPMGRADDVSGGRIVGDLGGRAFQWNADGSYVQLDTLLPRKSGWSLRRARGVASDGTIVGDGSRSASNRAFALMPPST